MLVDDLVWRLQRLAGRKFYGEVSGVQGLTAELAGLARAVAVGDRVTIVARGDRAIPAEIIGLRAGRALAMPLAGLDGVGLGARVELADSTPAAFPCAGWRGRAINGLGEPIDDLGPLPSGRSAYPLRAPAPPAHRRRRVAGKLDLGVRAINQFVTCCRGQRLGVFAGSGVGKSVLMSMIARHTAADIVVIGLIGERGREVREFIQNDLGADGLARAVVVVATSDESAPMRRRAALLTLAAAEYFRDQGEHVLCLIDSVTRIAMALREIGLSAGEAPSAKGYTPSVFAELPKLLERAGPGTGQGSITGLFTVLVEGDDLNEPIADAVRGILDGHIVLDRAIAEAGRYPAIDILRSLSRTLPACNSAAENAAATRARLLMARHQNMAEMIRLGAYRRGGDPETDEAIFYHPKLEAFLTQAKDERATMADGAVALTALLAETPE